MGYGDRFPFSRKERRCKHFDDDGRAKKDECPYRSFECYFTHPDEPEWKDCRSRFLGGKFPHIPPSHRDQRGSFSRRGRDRSRSRERDRDRGWGDRDGVRGRERERSRSNEGAQASVRYGPPKREDSVASSREDEQTTMKTAPSTPSIPTAPAWYRSGMRTSTDLSSHQTVKLTPPININVNSPPPPPARTPSPLPPPPSAEPPLSPFSPAWTTTPTAVLPSTASSGGFIVPSLPPPSTSAFTSNFAIPPPPSTSSPLLSSSALLGPPSTTRSVPNSKSEQPRTRLVIKSAFPLKNPDPSNANSSPLTTTDIASSSPVVQPTPPPDVAASAPISTVVTPTALIPTSVPDQSRDNDISLSTRSLSAAIPGLTSAQMAQAPSSTVQEAHLQPQQPPEPLETQDLPDSLLQPLLPPLPPLPNFELTETTTPQLSPEAKLELWSKRTKIMAELLAHNDKIQQLTSDIEDLTRYSTSSIFGIDAEEKQRVESNIDELQSTKDATKQTIQKQLDELAESDTWPRIPAAEDVQKQNEKMKEYVVGLADAMKEVSTTLKTLSELANVGRKKQKTRRKKRWEKDKDKEKEKEKAKETEVEGRAGADTMGVDMEVPTEALSTLSGLEQPTADGEDEGDTESDVETSTRSRELADIHAKFESLQDLVQNVANSLDQVQSSWMAGVKEMLQDLVLEQKRTVRERVKKHETLIEEHATQFKSSLEQVTERVDATNTKVTSVVDETAQALERIRQLRHERDTLLAGQKKFFEEELPGLKSQFNEYEVQRENDQKRIGALEAALNAYIKRPPSPPLLPLSTAMDTTNGHTNNNHKPTAGPGTEYLLKSIKPQLTQLLRESVKPLVEEVRRRVEEMVNAQREEMYASMWSKVEFTWEVLGKVQKSAEIDLSAILGSANSVDGSGGGGGNRSMHSMVVDEKVQLGGSGKPVTSEPVNGGAGSTANGGSTGMTSGLARSMANGIGSGSANGALAVAGPTSESGGTPMKMYDR